MHKYYDRKFNKDSISIAPGEFYVSEKDIIIQTVLGSCISVCLFSDFSPYSGMNHFMLPGNLCRSDIANCGSGRYGMYAMELLINSLMKLGVKKNALKAKVFGGGNVLDLKNVKKTVGENNVAFINSFLEKENIPIISSHIGGDYARKIFFFVESKKVLLKKIDKSKAFQTIKEEKDYEKALIEEDKKKTNIILF